MSDGTPQHSIEAVLAAVAPMENLDRFLIEDLTADDEDAFYGVLEQA